MNGSARLPAALLRGLVLIAIAWLLWIGLLWSQQRAMMFPGTLLSSPPLETLLQPGEEVWRVDGSAWAYEAAFLPAGGGEAPAAAVLYFGGNFERVADNLASLRTLSARGVHVLAAEYPGYGAAPGRPSKAALVEQAVRLYDRLAADPRVDPTRIAAVGRSLGSGPASALAAERRLRAVVLFSPFSSMARIARGYLAPPQLLRDPFDNEAALRAHRGPLLVVHGRRDWTLPFEHGQRLVDGHRQGRMLALDACGHNDCAFFAPAILDEIQALLR